MFKVLKKANTTSLEFWTMQNASSEGEKLWFFFSDKQKLKEFVACSPALHEMFSKSYLERRKMIEVRNSELHNDVGVPRWPSG